MYVKSKSFGFNTITVNDSLRERERNSSCKNEINDSKRISFSKVCLTKDRYYKSSICSTKTNERSKKRIKDSITNESPLFQQSKLSRSLSRETNVLIQITKRKNYLNFIIIVTIVFFCCQLPVRIFLCWSYLVHHFSPIILDSNSEIEINESYIFLINLISQITSLVYFLHCISNSIIYNILSVKFRKAFLNIVCHYIYYSF